MRHPAAKAEGAASTAAVGGAVSTLREAKLEAALSADVYSDKPHPPPGWRVASEGDLRSLQLQPRDLENGDTHFRARVYKQGKDGDARYVVAFRGTQTSGDWKMNFEQGLGFSSGSYLNALKLSHKLAGDQQRFVLTGHSLGGGLASAAAIASGKPAETFNASGLHAATIGSARAVNRQAGGHGPGKVDAYYVRGEVLSTLQDGAADLAAPILLGPAGLAVHTPPAYGARRPLEAVNPGGRHDGNPVDKHGLDWVQSGLDAAIRRARH